MSVNRPVSRTRDAIVSAFNRLVLSTRRARPPIAHLLREAGVARSTFYKHFDDRDSLLLTAADLVRVPAHHLCDIRDPHAIEHCGGAVNGFAKSNHASSPAENTTWLPSNCRKAIFWIPR